LLSYFQVEAPIHRPSVFLFFSLTIKDKTQISLTIKILHLGQGSFTRKVRTIFTLKIIVSIFVKLFLILDLHLRQFFIVRIFVKRATVPLKQKKRPVLAGRPLSTNAEKETRYIQYGQILLFQ
jgi:hypothetical protein